VFNTWTSPADGPPESIDGVSASLVVDGVPLQPDLIATPQPFTVTGARLNGVTGRKRPQPVTVWGFWKLIPALAPGQHELRAVGGVGSAFVVDIRYRLVVGATVPAYPVR
jgi:hypothetical protein